MKKNTYPATERQKVSWKEYLRDGGKTPTNICDVSTFEQPDLAAISTTLEILVKRHESLRTTFQLVDGKLYQLINECEKMPLQIRHYDFRKGLFLTQKINRMIFKLSQTLFDLEKGPLVRFAIIKTKEGGVVLVSVMHHIISDATSLNVLKSDFLHYYSLLVEQKPIKFELPAFQMKEFALWENKLLNTAQGQENLAYWQQELNGELEIFTLNNYWKPNRERNHKEGTGGEYLFFIQETLLSKIKDRAISLRTSKICFFYAALFLLLHLLSGQYDLIIIAPISLRDRRELMSLIGYLNTDIYLRMKLDTEQTVEELVKKTSDKYLRALDHRHHRMEEIVEKGQHFCGAVLNELPGRKEYIEDFTSRFISKNTRRKTVFPFFFMLTEFQNGLGISCIYNKNHISSRKIPEVIISFQLILESMLDRPSASLKELLANLLLEKTT